MPNQSINRREFLTVASLTAIGAAGACASRPQATYSQTTAGPRKRVLRIAHMTDFHVFSIGIAEDGMAKALHHAQNLADRPDIIINTGDAIMDSLQADRDNTEEQWATFKRILKAECKLPVYHAIGNHDVWGWGWKSEGMLKDPLYGKAMAVKQLELKNRYYSFERAGWHFVVLDSTHEPNDVSKHPYIGKIDEEQYDWLIKDIEAVADSTPICFISHIPIFCGCEFFDGENEESGNWVVPAAWMHIDARRFRQFFLQHRNIRLCLSGHAHQHEVLDYLGVRYQTNGAICGNWWRGAYLDFPPAYVIVDLYDDGSSESQFIPYDA